MTRRRTFGMRYVLAGVAGLLAAAFTGVVILAFAFFFGGTECDRGECNWLGEAVEGNNVLVGIVAYGLMIAAGVMAARAILRRG